MMANTGNQSMLGVNVLREAIKALFLEPGHATQVRSGHTSQ